MHLKTLTPERQVSESGYRSYSPSLGRWCSRDPIGEQDGVQLYCFIKNQPVVSTDSFGMFQFKTKPTTWANAPWSWKPNDFFGGDAMDTFATIKVVGRGSCDCCPVRDPGGAENPGDVPQNLVCEFKLLWHIFLNSQVDGDISKEKRYGHEQQHAKSLITYVDTTIRLGVEPREENAKNIPLKKCKQVKADTEQWMTTKWNAYLLAEKEHENDESPPAHEGVTPNPAMPALPTPPPKPFK